MLRAQRGWGGDCERWVSRELGSRRYVGISPAFRCGSVDPGGLGVVRCPAAPGGRPEGAVSGRAQEGI